jgi:competence protein ComEA
MAFRPLVHSLIVPVLGLSLSGIASHPAVAGGDLLQNRGTVNINQATSPELARLPRVGVKLADRVVAHRTQHGPFKRIEDLMEVKGVGEKMFASLKPYLAVSGPTTLTQKVASTGSRGGSKGRTKGKPSPAPASKKTGA